jgi:hypothetical protein
MDVDKLFTSLKQTFTQKIPGGLSQEASSRLNRSLRHYIQQGGSEQDILRETYSSMAAWLKRNSGYLQVPEPKKAVQEFRQTPLTMASFDNMADYTTGVTMPEEDTESPLDKFEKLKARRNGLEAMPIQTADMSLTQAMSPSQAAITRPAFFKQPQPSVQPKDFLLKQEDIVKYRESEYNLVLNSKDRDWVNNTKENRYNFAVQLDSGTRPQGTNQQVSITNRFRNIIKIEFVKIILPVEGLDVVVQRDCAASGSPADASLSFVSVLATPFITVVMDEMTGNNYGTNEKIDKSLAICQYDATWKSETTSVTTTTNRGYTLFFPKFMKAQRIYAPTPLASLQKMSFSILNPENAPLSSIPDAYSVSNILLGANSNITSCYKDLNSEYLFVRLEKWFPVWAFSVLDRLQFAGIVSTTGNDDIVEWIQQEQGHVVVGTAYESTNVFARNIVDGTNNAGYANYIIIRNRFNDPTTGVATRKTFNAEIIPNINTDMLQGSVINLSRQVQMTLRITVRELDSTTNLRPDNV